MAKLKELKTWEVETEISNIPPLDYLYVVTARRKHESGFRIFDVYGENRKRNYKKKIGNCSDIVQFSSDDMPLVFPQLRVEADESGVMGFYCPAYQFKVKYICSDLGIVFVRNEK